VNCDFGDLTAAGMYMGVSSFTYVNGTVCDGLDVCLRVADDKCGSVVWVVNVIGEGGGGLVFSS
jgi:hypothetical protein